MTTIENIVFGWTNGQPIRGDTASTAADRRVTLTAPYMRVGAAKYNNPESRILVTPGETITATGAEAASLIAAGVARPA
jgi:hypothetical protein